MGQVMARMQTGRIALMLCSAAILTACGENSEFDLFKKKPGGGAEVTSDAPAPDSTRLIERDVEVPEVFQASDKGLWDGRPSLGGVWVAHPDVTEPERVIIRNDENGKFVIGALFKRERENPGPSFQVSSDAAAALGMLAGAPDQLNVTALRRQEVPVSGESAAAPPAEVDIAELAAPEAIETATLDDPAALAAAALDAAETAATPEAPLSNVTPTSAPAASAPPAAPPARPAASLDKPFVQIGLFSVKDNADRNGAALRDAGIVPVIREEESNGKTYWRVLAGPAPSSAERGAILAKVKNLGYADAYFVRN